MSDLFAEGEQQASPAPQNSPTSQESSSVFTDQLASIKNPDGTPKYSTVDKALEALQHSQAHIPQLQQEKDSLVSEVETLKRQLAEAKKLEELVERLQPQGQPEPVTPASSLTEEGVLNILAQREKAQVQQGNMASVQSALVEKFGDQAQEAVKAKAAELGTTAAELGKLAQSNPKMVLAYFNSAPAIKGQTAPKPSTVSTAGLQPQQEGLQKPTKSLLSGASLQERIDYLKQIRADVYKRFDVQA